MIIDKLNSLKTEYFRFGSGSRPLVILPGIGLQRVSLSAAAVKHTYKDFCDDFTVFVIDRREELPERCGIELFADDVAAAMDALGIGSADIFGASMGGMIAQLIALRHPEKVDSLILGSTLARPNPTSEKTIGEWIRLAEEKDLDRLAQNMLPKLYTPRLADQLLLAVDLLFLNVTEKDFERFTTQARAIEGFDILDRLGDIRCPALVLGVEGDKVVTAEASREIAAQMNAELYIYDSSHAHCVFDEDRDFQKRMLDFLLKRANTESNR